MSNGIYEITGYVMSGGSGDGIKATKTSTGTVPRRFITIAVNPKIIPYGTRVKIDGWGDQIFIAEDTGGDINKKPPQGVVGYIDIYFGDDVTNKNTTYKQEALNYGRQRRMVTIVGSSDTSVGKGSAPDGNYAPSGGRSYSAVMASLAGESGLTETSTKDTIPVKQILPTGGKHAAIGNVNALTFEDRHISEFARVAINYDLQVAGAGGVNVPEVIRSRASKLGEIIVAAEKEIAYNFPSSNINKDYTR